MKRQTGNPVQDQIAVAVRRRLDLQSRIAQISRKPSAHVTGSRDACTHKNRRVAGAGGEANPKGTVIAMLKLDANVGAKQGFNMTPRKVPRFVGGL